MCGINYKKIISIRSFCDQESYRKYLNGRFYFMSKLLESYFYKKADYVVGVSNEQRKSIEEEYGMLKSKIRIIENLYDIKEIERLSKLNIENNVEKFFSTHDVAVYVGRLIKKKGHENLLDIFEKVVAVYERAGLLLLGDGPLMEELIAKRRKLNIENNVLFLGNCNPPYPYMARAKLFVGVSFNEGFPNALMEAMACGIPVMHTACPTGPREILQREYNERKIERVEFTDYGVLMPDLGKLTDLEKEVMEKDIVEVWVEFLKNEELRKQYALLAKKRAGDYSYQRCIERYRNIIEAE